MKGPLSSSIARRRPDTHKGDYGHVLVVGGGRGMTGAPILCAEGALRSGAGLVSLAVPREVYPVVDRKAPPEIMVHPAAAIPVLLKRATVLAIGPGLGRGRAQKGLVRRLLVRASQPAVIDADGVVALQGLKRLPRSRGTGERVITPHPGEMGLMLGIPAARVQADRKGIAAATAKRLGAVVLLKGHRTVIASPSGRIAVNPTGNPGMATAGMGDVLTGVIAALIGQGADAFHAAVAGAYLHGLAGDLAAKRQGQVSLTAGDLLRHLPAAFRRSLR